MPTPKQDYERALKDVARRFDRLDRETVKQSLVYLRELRDRLQLQLTSAETFEAFRLEELTRNVNDLIARYEAQMMSLSRSALTQSSRLGALAVVEPLQAAGLGVGFFQPTPAQFNVILDYSAELIRGIGADTRKRINGIIRRSALGEQSTIKAMQAINTELGIKRAPVGVAYEGERILRTEQGRIFNLATHSQQQATAKQVPGLQKQWLATGDGRTRFCHLVAHGQLVLVDDPFRVCGEDLMYPMDPAGRADNTINCRCRSVTVHPEIGPIAGPLDEQVERERAARQ